ncbi:MAG: LPXTG cell wall anchor domain-containing protein [Oscillospiraceae bacterium]|nr:LPXTG cell wall anchor domain-containing protein [Oscillospiraceae bacterium]
MPPTTPPTTVESTTVGIVVPTATVVTTVPETAPETITAATEPTGNSTDTGTPGDLSDDKINPQTGDNIIWIFAIFALAGIGATIIIKKRLTTN